jgi:hypothetical protein
MYTSSALEDDQESVTGVPWYAYAEGLGEMETEHVGAGREVQEMETSPGAPETPSPVPVPETTVPRVSR